MTRSETCLNVCIICVICPFAPIWLPILVARGFYRRIHPGPSPKEKAYRKRYKDRPRPLPMTRIHLSQVSIAPEHALTSRFLLLPREIRNHIYSYLYVNRFIFRLDKIPHRLTQEHCLYSDTWGENQHLRESSSKPFEHPWRFKTQSLHLSLIKTCRQIYTEVAPLLYSTNTFKVDQLDNLIYLNQTIRPNRMASIRYLQVMWAFNIHVPLTGQVPDIYRPMDDETWIRFWNIIATRMTGLQGLDLAIRLHRGDFRLEKQWLKPVMKVRGLKKFILDISYMAYDIFENEADYLRPNADTLNFRHEVIETVCQQPHEQLQERR
ncbi:hypothetical protein MMC14_002308 [Varicellaria rhodocarpa]|nr:hypothetical protein [Varicellaria rhodocarpa]